MIVYVDLRIADSTPRSSVISVWHWCQSYEPLWTPIVLTAKVWWRLFCRYGSQVWKTLILTLDRNLHDANDGVSTQLIYFSLNMSLYMSDLARAHSRAFLVYVCVKSCVKCVRQIIMFMSFVPPSFFSEKCRNFAAICYLFWQGHGLGLLKCPVINNVELTMNRMTMWKGSVVMTYPQTIACAVVLTSAECFSIFYLSVLVLQPATLLVWFTLTASASFPDATVSSFQLKKSSKNLLYYMFPAPISRQTQLAA